MIARLRQVVADKEERLAAQDTMLAAQRERLEVQDELIQKQCEQIEAQAERVGRLDEELAELRRRVGMDSTNSSVPPSKDRKPGGQPGVARHSRCPYRGRVPALRMPRISVLLLGSWAAAPCR